jgi:hypothetical protein
LLLQFFQELQVSKAQVDALLYRLSRHWEREFDALCTRVQSPQHRRFARRSGGPIFESRITGL